MTAPVSRLEAFTAARAVLDRARARRDSMPIRAAAEAAAVGSTRTADEIELILRRLRRTAAQTTRTTGSATRAAA